MAAAAGGNYNVLILGGGTAMGRMRGIAIPLPWSGGRTSGIQVSPFNIAGDVKGLQIGVVNVARRLKGVQLGVLNIAYKNALPVMIGLNAGF